MIFLQAYHTALFATGESIQGMDGFFGRLIKHAVT
jgi:hypothetical protein